jgi:uncharacterized membrane protein YidH (DUF202 family)
VTATGAGGAGGTAAERTALAWQRSGLALAATGAAVARGVPGSTVSDRPLLGTGVAVLGLLVWMAAALTERRRARRPVRPVATIGDLAPLAGATAVVGVVLLVLGALPR